MIICLFFFLFSLFDNSGVVFADLGGYSLLLSIVNSEEVKVFMGVL
jgi:hypothetical protein